MNVEWTGRRRRVVQGQEISEQARKGAGDNGEELGQGGGKVDLDLFTKVSERRCTAKCRQGWR